jgi:hypothetical protein
MWHTSIDNHYEEVWKATANVCEFSAGPVEQLLHEFAVLKFPPREDREMWTYATRCMSLPDDHVPIELHMFSPFETNEVVELLVATAHFHRLSTKLNVGDSVNFGRSWVGQSACDHGLISLPYLDGPNLHGVPGRVPGTQY